MYVFFSDATIFSRSSNTTMAEATCINPANGSDSGDTWDKRAMLIKSPGSKEEDL